jgi:BirA family transcriptional regulator, biotin operon repressor / biotin---[acetyl-CoA-carboxylase] ligase
VTDDALGVESLRAAWESVGLAPNVVSHAVTGSTNDDAKALAAAGCAAGLVVVSDAQTRGRGRQGNVWHSPPEQCLYFSLVLRPTLRPENASPFALVVGVEVARAIEELCPHLCCLLKWPNDVGLVGRSPPTFLKVGGVLVESVVRGASVSALIVGVGVNVRLSDVPAPLEGLVTSLHEHGPPPRRPELAARLARNLVAAAGAFERRGLEPWLEELARRDVLRGAEVAVGDVVGIADGIDPAGALRIAVAKVGGARSEASAHLPGADAAVRCVASGHVDWDRRARVPS